MNSKSLNYSTLASLEKMTSNHLPDAVVQTFNGQIYETKGDELQPRKKNFFNFEFERPEPPKFGQKCRFSVVSATEFFFHTNRS